MKVRVLRTAAPTRHRPCAGPSGPAPRPSRTTLGVDGAGERWPTSAHDSPAGPAVTVLDSLGSVTTTLHLSPRIVGRLLFPRASEPVYGSAGRTAMIQFSGFGHAGSAGRPAAACAHPAWPQPAWYGHSVRLVHRLPELPPAHQHADPRRGCGKHIVPSVPPIMAPTTAHAITSSRGEDHGAQAPARGAQACRPTALR